MEFGSYIFTDKDDQTIFHNHGEILRQYGSQYKPEHESLYIAYREVERKIQENARDIRRWELKDEILPSETLIKEHKIAELIAKQESLKNEQSSLPICENLAVVFKAVTQLNAALFKGSDSLKLTDVINENLVSLKWFDAKNEKNSAPRVVPLSATARPLNDEPDQNDAVKSANTKAPSEALPLKKAALIKKHQWQWPTINRDFQDASDNDLSKAAKAPKYGFWFEEAALNWARQRGKLNEQSGPVAVSAGTVWHSKKHRIQG